MQRHETPSVPRPDRLLLAVLVGVVVSIALSSGLTHDVWSTGIFIDTDDATRMAQVRAWMAGQAWYDLHLHRLGLPGAEPMHWTRLVDAPVALLVKAASLVLNAEMAERWARIAFPLLLIVGVLFISGLIAAELVGPAHALTACLLVSLIGLPMLQFQPGRIDHHGPQMLLLLTSGLFALRALDACRAWRSGFLSATGLAASMAISLENLPAACVIATSFPVLWAAQGESRRAGLNGFASGLIVAPPFFYALTVAPDRWNHVACDAQSALHVTLTLAMAAPLAALSTSRLAPDRAYLRWGGLAVIGLAGAIVLRAGFPQCGLDPYSGIDPLVRREWLDNVREAFSIRRAWSEGLTRFVLVNFLPCLTGLGGLALASWRQTGDARLRWLIWLALALVAGCVAGLRIGYVQTLQATSCFGALYLLTLAPQRWRALRIPGAFGLSVVAMALVIPADENARAEAEAKGVRACGRPQAAAGIAALPTGLVLAPIDEGAYLLALTPHRIVAAPYHRNNDGNRLEAEAFAAPAGEALRMLRSRFVDYVAICAEEKRRSPLIAALAQGAPGTIRMTTAGAYEVWRIER